MNSYAAGLAVNVTLEFHDLNGDPVTPTALSYMVQDENGTELIPGSVLPLEAGATSATILIPAEHNRLAPRESAGVRVVTLFMNDAAGAHEVYTTYMLRRPQRLQVLDNSFITYPKSILIADEIPRLDAWNMANAMDRQAALIEAYTRLTRFGYIVKRPEEADSMSYLTDDLWGTARITPQMWPVMEAAYFNALPQNFRTALAKAQVAEANEILAGDVVGELRRSGLLSKSVGESSMMFRSGKPLEMGISHQALNYLTGFVDLRMTVTRS